MLLMCKMDGNENRIHYSVRHHKLLNFTRDNLTLEYAKYIMSALRVGITVTN